MFSFQVLILCFFNSLHVFAVISVVYVNHADMIFQVAAWHCDLYNLMFTVFFSSCEIIKKNKLYLKFM